MQIFSRKNRYCGANRHFLFEKIVFARKNGTILLGFATRTAKVVFSKDIFRCGKGIDQFSFAGIVDVAEQDVAVCFECHNSSAGIRFAHGKVDGLMQVLLDDVGGISFCAEERDVG